MTADVIHWSSFMQYCLKFNVTLINISILFMIQFVLKINLKFFSVFNEQAHIYVFDSHVSFYISR